MEYNYDYVLFILLLHINDVYRCNCAQIKKPEIVSTKKAHIAHCNVLVKVDTKQRQIHRANKSNLFCR